MPNVFDELPSKGQLDIATVHVARLLLVDEEQVISARTASDVDVLPQLDVSIGPEDRQPAITPGAESIGREPVHAHVAASAIATQEHVAEVVQLRELRMREVRDL